MSPNHPRTSRETAGLTNVLNTPVRNRSVEERFAARSITASTFPSRPVASLLAMGSVSSSMESGLRLKTRVPFTDRDSSRMDLSCASSPKGPRSASRTYSYKVPCSVNLILNRTGRGCAADELGMSDSCPAARFMLPRSAASRMLPRETTALSVSMAPMSVVLPEALGP